MPLVPSNTWTTALDPVTSNTLARMRIKFGFTSNNTVLISFPYPFIFKKYILDQLYGYHREARGLRFQQIWEI